MSMRSPQVLEIRADTPVRHLALADMVVGDSVVEHVTLDHNAVDAFAEVSGDRAPLHMDDAFAGSRGFDGRVVHGLLIGARFSRLVGMFLPGVASVIHTFSQGFPRPTPVGGTVELSATVHALHPSVGMVTIKLACHHEGNLVCQGEAKCVIR